MNYPEIIEAQEATVSTLHAENYLSTPDWAASKKIDWQYIFLFKGKDRAFTLKSGVPCYFYHEDGDLVGECPTFGFISTGRTKEEILKHFDIEFGFIYDEYFLEDDSHLTNDAIILKKLIGSLISN